MSRPNKSNINFNCSLFEQFRHYCGLYFQNKVKVFCLKNRHNITFFSPIMGMPGAQKNLFLFKFCFLSWKLPFCPTLSVMALINVKIENIAT